MNRKILKLLHHHHKVTSHCDTNDATTGGHWGRYQNGLHLSTIHTW